VFELTTKTLTELVDAINESAITSFHVKTDQFELTISCGDDERAANLAADDVVVETKAVQPEAVLPATAPAAATAPTAPAAPAPANDPAAARIEGTEVVSPMIGAFYAAPEPGAPPFVEVGDTVTPDTTVGLVEAMKVFTAVSAGSHGVVREVLVENGQLVEYGQPLVVLDPAGPAGSANAA
jgi:acetyl-CoA carboxylase biotin carboxyl carrier protein